MRIRIIQLLFLSLCFIIAGDVNGQSIGYVASYTLPYHNDQTNDYQPPLIREYSKGSEYSVGLILNNYTNRIKAFQIRLTTYSSKLINEINGFTGFVRTESKITKYLVELEGYFYAKQMFKDVSISLGAKYSHLLRSKHKSFSETFGNRVLLKEAGFGGPPKFKIDLLLKLSWRNIKICEDLAIVPSYVFGYGISRDFKAKYISSSSLNHRFELAFIKNINTK